MLIASLILPCEYILRLSDGHVSPALRSAEDPAQESKNWNMLDAALTSL